VKHISRPTAHTLLLSLALAAMAGALYLFPGAFASLVTPPTWAPATMALLMLGWAGYDIAESVSEGRAS